MQKFVLRSVLRPNQISFWHSLGPRRLSNADGETGLLTLMSFVKHCGHDRYVLHARQREVD